MLKKTTLALCLSAAALSAPAFGDEDREQGRDAIPDLRHVSLIMMENHAASEILGNTANAPFISQLAQSANVAANYFAVGHPSLPNYLHVVGGSNFGVAGDPTPKWRNDPGSPGTVVPLAGSGIDQQQSQPCRHDRGHQLRGARREEREAVQPPFAA